MQGCVCVCVVSFCLKRLHMGALEPSNKPVGLGNGHCLAEGQSQVGVSSQRVSDTVAMPCSSVGGSGLVGFLLHQGRRAFLCIWLCYVILWNLTFGGLDLGKKCVSIIYYIVLCNLYDSSPFYLERQVGKWKSKEPRWSAVEIKRKTSLGNQIRSEDVCFSFRTSNIKTQGSRILHLLNNFKILFFHCCLP